MKSKTQRIAITALFGILAFALIAVAQQPNSNLPVIEPFGGLTWQDGFADGFQKIKGMAGIQSITVKISGEVAALSLSADVTILSETIKKSKAFSRYEIGEERHQNNRDLDYKEYFDVKGVKRRYPFLSFQEVSIIAEPILIAGIPYTLTAIFKNEPGFGLAYPAKIFPLTSCDFPLVLRRVKLTTKSPGLKEHVKDINKLVYSKFAGYMLDGDASIYNATGVFVGRDEQGGCSITYNSHDGSIEYKCEEHNGETDRLSELYRKHIANLESQQFKNAPDMKSGL